MMMKKQRKVARVARSAVPVEMRLSLSVVVLSGGAVTAPSVRASSSVATVPACSER